MTFIYLIKKNPDNFIRILFVYMIFQKDVHALNDPSISSSVKVDDDEIVFRQGTLIVACKLGEQSPESDGHVSVLFFSVLLYFVNFFLTRAMWKTRTVQI